MKSKNILAAVGIAIAAVFAFAGAAWATNGIIDHQVSFGWGDWLAGVLREQAGPLAVALTGAAIHFMPGGTGTLIQMFRIDQLLKNAINSGINKTAGAVAGKSLTAKVGNEVIERGLEYAAANAPNLFKKLPVNEWREKILARLNLGAEVSADHLFVSPNRAG